MSSYESEETATSGVRLQLMTISVAVYKYYTLCKSFLELDLILSLVFMLTSIFIWFNLEQRDSESRRNLNLYLLIPEVAILLGVIVNNWHGHFLVRDSFPYKIL